MASYAAARLSDAALPPLDQTTAPWPGRRFPISTGEVFVRATPAVSADPQPALFVHGLGGASTNWTDFAAQLRPWLDIEALDLPGFGHSAPPPRRDYTMLRHAGAVVDYLERSGRAPVHLFGNSMGGVISILIAAVRPELVRTLTLVSPAVPDLRPRRLGTDPLLAIAVVPGTGRLVTRRIRRYTAEQRAQAVINLCFYDPSAVPPQRLAEAVDELHARDGMPWATEALIGSLRGLMASYLVPRQRGLWARMRQVQAPTLVVWGADDRLVDAALAPRVASTIPDARLLVLPQVGHVAQLEAPVVTARAALALIEDAAVASRAAPASGEAR